MTLPETDLARTRRWIDARNDRLPERAAGQTRYEMDVDARSVTLLECSPPWRKDVGPEWTRFPVARLRYAKARQEWALYWRDRNLKLHRYDIVDPSPDVESLLDEVDADPTCIFWREAKFGARHRGARSLPAAPSDGGHAWQPLSGAELKLMVRASLSDEDTAALRR